MDKTFAYEVDNENRIRYMSDVWDGLAIENDSLPPTDNASIGDGLQHQPVRQDTICLDQHPLNNLALRLASLFVVARLLFEGAGN